MNRAQLTTTRRETTYMDVENADIAGANICHPWWLNTRIRPPRTVEVQVLHEQKTCHAGDGRCQLRPAPIPCR
jgi:hypothetical protein